MGETTAIEWCDHTFNPWWGCAHVSPGCVNCYAETLSKRWGNDVWGKGGSRRFFGDTHWNEPLKWNRKAEAEGVRRRVFCGSMMDVFEDRPDLISPRARLFQTISQTPHLDWLLLTKRPENSARLTPLLWAMAGWPKNIWLGTSVEDQKRADERIPKLLEIPAIIRFLSCEPLLGPVDLEPWLSQPVRTLDWVIVGGESGPKARPMDPEWARSLRDECVCPEVAFFFKQWGGPTPKSGGRKLDGRTWDQWPIRATTPAQSQSAAPSAPAPTGPEPVAPLAPS
jgi:protein gp37